MHEEPSRYDKPTVSAQIDKPPVLVGSSVFSDRQEPS